jgi:hypothetical protein
MSLEGDIPDGVSDIGGGSGEGPFYRELNSANS